MQVECSGVLVRGSSKRNRALKIDLMRWKIHMSTVHLRTKYTDYCIGSQVSSETQKGGPDVMPSTVQLCRRNI